MKIAIKLLFSLIVILLVTGVALAVFLPLYFDPNDYKDQIAKAVKDETGRELQIPGKIELTLFPWLGMKLGETSLGNAPGFSNEPMAQIREATVRVKLMPLLHKQIQVGAVTLDGLVLRLAKDASGKGNWEGMVKEKTAEEKAREEAERKKNGEKFAMKSFDVSSIEIKNSSVTWDDAQAASHYKLDNFRLTTGGLRAGAPFLLDTGFEFNASKPALTGVVDLKGKVKPDLKASTYNIEGLVLKVETSGESIPGGKQKATLNGDVDLNLKAQTLKVANLVLEAADGKVTGQLSGTQILDKPAFTGQLSTSQIDPRELMKLVGTVPPVTSDSSVLSKASLNTRFTATTDSAAFKDLQVKLDDTSLSGIVNVNNFSKPAIAFALKLDGIDVDRYLPPVTKEKSGDKSDSNSVQIPVETIRPLNLNGTLSVGKLKIKNLRFDNAELTLRSQNGVLEIEPLTSNFYQGRIQLSSRIDTTEARPAYRLSAQTDNIKVDSMLKDLTGKASVNGTGRMSLNLTSAGQTVGEMKRGMNGTVNFEFKDGAINGFNLGQKLRAAKAMYKGQSLKDDEPQTTDFALISATLQVVNGVISNNDLTGKNPAFRVGGDGEASLITESMDYLARISVVDTSKGQGGKDLEELKNLTIPVRIYGNLFAPQWKFDFGSLLKDKAKEALDKEKDKLQDKAKSKLNDALGGVLGGKAAKGAAAPAADGASTAAPATTDSSTAAPAAEQKPKSTEDQLKDLFGKKKKKKPAATAPASEAAPAAAPATEAAPAAAPATEPAPAEQPATPAQ